MITTIVAWIVLGALAGYTAGFIMKGDESLGCIGHIVLGIVGALIGGFLAEVLGLNPGTGDGDVLNFVSIVVAAIGAVIVLAVVNYVRRSRGSGGAV